MVTNDFFKKLSETHPFMSVCSYGNQEYVGIIQNRDDNITTLYDYGSIIDKESKQKFLELGDIWWWESNRLIPINLFLKDEWNLFRSNLKIFNSKSLIILHGYVCNMADLHKRRIKRRSITLVKRMP